MINPAGKLLVGLLMGLGLAAIPAKAQGLPVQLDPPAALGSSTDRALPGISNWQGRGLTPLGEDIFIEGLRFSKLVLRLAIPKTRPRDLILEAHAELLEKNLCWSGLFVLVGGRHGYCAPAQRTRRNDLQLELQPAAGRYRISVSDATQPGEAAAIELFAEDLPASKRFSEQPTIDLVNRLSERLTGKPGLLGSSIAFVLRPPSRRKVIAMTDTHGVRIERVSNNRQINLLPRFSHGGEKLVYTVLGRQGSRVYLHHLDANTGTITVRNGFVTPFGSLTSGGAFSPSGNSIALTMSPRHNTDLYLLPLLENSTDDTQAARRLTFRAGIETQVDWTRDGKHLLFVSDRTGTPQIYRLDRGTNSILRLTFESVYNADPRWSPDGRQILFTRRVGGRDQIYVMDAYGENVRPLIRSRYDAEQPAWSPDGQQIVFTSNRSGEFKLYVVSIDGSNLRRLTQTTRGSEESSPTWSLRPFRRASR